REKLSLAECVEALIYIIGGCSGKESPTLESSFVGTDGFVGTGEPMRPKDIIFTVSPIRHLADGAHENQLSKSTLLLAVDETIRISENRTCGNDNRNTPETDDIPMPALDYFPAYEIMMDELRDYRFYAEDMLHPSAQAIAHIADRFLAHHLAPADRPLLEERIRLHKQSLHRPNM
ncbi:MAG: GSCFA domain-containing protein, partial [Bacteroidales bacterium]|nr:GSCFA domain-containing protein [Bacteroidales bacterium]